jgi:hypothetical protein
MRSFLSPRTAALVAMIILAALSRLLPHPSNFAPITAPALFGAANFDRKWKAFLVPLSAMLLSDVCFEVLYRLGLSPAWGFHRFMAANYGAFAVIAGMGLWLRHRQRFVPVAGTVLASSLVFFVVTNSAVWAFTADAPFPSGYPKTWAGLVECYAMAVPYFHWTLLGDVTYATTLFGGFALLTRVVPALREPMPAQA